jgi:hypothetical protein
MSFRSAVVKWLVKHELKKQLKRRGLWRRKEGLMGSLLNLVTLGPLAGYRTVIGWLMVLYSIAGKHFGWPGADDALLGGGGLIGIGIRFANGGPGK